MLDWGGLLFKRSRDQVPALDSLYFGQQIQKDHAGASCDHPNRLNNCFQLFVAMEPGVSGFESVT